MTKKTLIILIALFGILLVYRDFEGNSWLFTGRGTIMLLVVRACVILVAAGGLLFLLGKGADDKIKLRNVLVSIKKIIINPLVIFLLVAIPLVIFLLVAIIMELAVGGGFGFYDAKKEKKVVPPSSPSFQLDGESSGSAEGLHKLDRFFK